MIDSYGILPVQCTASPEFPPGRRVCCGPQKRWGEPRGAFGAHLKDGLVDLLNFQGSAAAFSCSLAAVLLVRKERFAVGSVWRGAVMVSMCERVPTLGTEMGKFARCVFQVMVSQSIRKI